MVMINRFVALAILFGGLLLAVGAGAGAIIDLTAPGAMEELRQSLTFTLDDTRYRLYVMRSDLVARVVPAY